MKYNRISTSIIAFCAAMTMQAQSGFDAGTISEKDLDGTARFVSMGGALGALGADITTMSTNPAGTAIMRQMDASVSFGAQFTGAPGELGKNRARPTINQAGVLFVFGKRDTGIRNFNFGVNYRSARSFHDNMSVGMNYAGKGTQLNQIAQLSNASYADMINAYSNYRGSDKDFDYLSSWGVLPDYFGEMTGWLSARDNFDYMRNNIKNGSMDMLENIVSAQQAETGLYSRTSWGANSQVDINFSLNYEDRVFVGASVGIYTLTNNRRSSYTENFGETYYTLSNYYRSKATGADVKLGIIARPFESSPFRIGLSVHTPIWYNLADNNGFVLEAKDTPGFYNKSYDSEEYVCNFRTPWVLNASVGHTFGNMVAIGAEYEFRDCGSCRYSAHKPDGYDLMTSNSEVKRTLKPQHVVKLGLELKPAKVLALRLGYNYVTSAYKDDAYYSLPYYSTYTETDYTKWGDIHRITAGIGFKFKRFYIDLAYQHQMQKGDFYPYYEAKNVAVSERYYEASGPNLCPATSISCNRGQFIATLGLKF